MEKGFRICRRKDPRMMLKADGIIVDLIVKPDEGAAVKSRLFNVSMGGLALNLKTSIAPRSNVKVILSRKLNIAVNGRVAWIGSDAKMKGMPHQAGIEFLYENEREKKKLLKFVRNILEHFPKEKLLAKTIELFSSGQQAYMEMRQYLDELVKNNYEMQKLICDFMRPLEAILDVYSGTAGNNQEFSKMIEHVKTIKNGFGALLERIDERASNAPTSGGMS